MNESEEHAQTSARPLCRESVPVVSQTLEQLGTGVAKAKGKEGIILLVTAGASITRMTSIVPRGGPAGGDLGGGASGVVTVVWRVVVLVAEGSLEQETSIKARTENAESSMIALFIT